MARSRLRSLGIGLIAAAVASSVAIAAGLFPGFPIVGGASYCNGVSGTGSGTGSSTFPTTPGAQFGQGSAGQSGTFANPCTITVNAGPVAITGNELIPADTQLPSGQQPQTVLIPTSMLAGIGQGSERNRLRGGDFTTNLWQRGTTFTALTPTTAAYTADGWWAYSSGNTTTITKQTGATDIILGSGARASMRVSRPSGTDVTPICVGQILPSTATSQFLGNNAVFSFWSMAPTSFSPQNDSVDVTLAYATAADSATVNTNTDAFAKGTIAGYTVVSTVNVPQTQTFTRYSVAGLIPTTATTIGVKICFTPLASTGASTDWYEFALAQLEATNVNNTSPGSFARRSFAAEAQLQQSYSFGLIENTNVIYAGGVLCSATANALIALQYPTQMRGTPTVAVTAGGFSIQTAVAVTAIGTTTLLAATSQHATLTSAAACTSTLPYQLKGTNTTGLLMFSAEP